MNPFASKLARDVPPDVERYVKETKEAQPGKEASYYWAVAWSRYCQHKDPGSEHCKQDSYFPGRKKKGSLRGAVIRLAYLNPDLRPHLLPLLSRRGNLTWDGFDLDEVEPTPEEQAMDFVRGKLGELRVVDAGLYLKPSRLLESINHRLYVTSHGHPRRAVYIYAEAPPAQAASLAKAYYGAFRPKRDYDASMPYYMEWPVWVGTNDGKARSFDPPAKRAPSKPPTDPRVDSLQQDLQSLIGYRAGFVRATPEGGMVQVIIRPMQMDKALKRTLRLPAVDKVMSLDEAVRLIEKVRQAL